jgi:glycosyltransferase involved in cell wall biosynthesis
MVGTVEPRKGHAQVLRAFELLWARGVDANLVIVGKQGWMVEKFIAWLRDHEELGKRAFWLDGISDEYLEHVYAACSCLIAASEGEGFGLPLIEAAQHGLAVMARDIPVFREVAGEHAQYFRGAEASALAEACEKWLEAYARGAHPKPQGMPWLTWKQSAERICSLLLNGEWYATWVGPRATRRPSSP